ncbi:MAG: ABC-2 transporter permease [Clostridia bacterium]|nr:ABC-2 transporter permease [Clostridia bacterium]
MKALLYKEFKLAMHPICYIFIALFPFLILIPSYPIAIGFIYVLSCYPILFLGANKGQQSNDLLYSTLLPVRKKDIVLARIITVAIMQFAYILLVSCLSPLARVVHSNIIASGGTVSIPGLNMDGFVSILAIAIIGFSIADIIFFPIYYKKGKSIVMSTLLTIIGFIVYLAVFTIIIPSINGAEAYKDFLCNRGLGVQFILLAAALVVYFVLHFITFKISAKRLEKVDF